ncbi:ATP-binding protein [Cupriavidus consociatus]|uniref:ATP-binding protein n=1 Tax=Cupriavidus consociatus TaxID=2821357 RepID=UPI001AE9A694|nr:MULTISPECIES: ATP-binding protein [unclassified Cupriavidus]MBP0621995.1 ATP-binding protein [Cupriavidus sp. LEh25]MDK2658670.1 ATP-binding protein [Cupriavidus sp. LEh21]
MNRLVNKLASLIRGKVEDSVKGRTNAKLESRFIFHGPPLSFLDSVYDELVREGGISVGSVQDGTEAILPVLLQLPHGSLAGRNPDIGVSGKCDESHLLHIRNDPNSPSFLALMPPGQHNNMSVASTTEEFGMNASSNTGHATFEEWWADGFVQQLVTDGLHDAGFAESQVEEARLIVEKAAAAIDEVDPEEGSRTAVWRLLSRIYSISGNMHGLSAGSALALACGTPSMEDGGISAKLQLGILERVAEEVTDGFKSCIERIAANANESTKPALWAFLAHVQAKCEIPTAFERATQAFYLPLDSIEIACPPLWWSTLTTECWAELLADEPDEAAGDLSISCTNAILPVARGMPAIVKDDVELSIFVGAVVEGEPVQVELTGGSHGKSAVSILVEEKFIHHDTPPSVGQRSPILYKVVANGRKAATARVISLASWAPGIIVACRMASKLAPPKKPRKSNAGPDWETALSLPGSGRYELLLLVSPGTSVDQAAGVPDDATEQLNGARQPLRLHLVRDGQYQVEIEADGNSQLEIAFRPAGRDAIETCTVYISCEDVKEEGCRSEFERLIKLNRRHLEKFDTKAVVQLDRHARVSSLQAWILDERNVGRSFIPMVLADDYASHWTSPDWSTAHGPILSQARFLHDPRPEASLFRAPQSFVDARETIAARIRETSDHAGLLESAPLGKWLARDPSFRSIVESYLDAYTAWLAADPDVACWVDAIAVCSREAGGRTLARIPDAFILSPMHPLRLAWHCLAQQVLYEELEGEDPRPCPAASILDPDCVPDLLTMSLQAPSGPAGIDKVDFLSVECNSDYWAVLWNGSRLDEIATKSRQAPFDSAFGLVVGGISSGFSPAQVARALDDVSDLLAAKPAVSLVVSSAGGASDACNEGLATWCAKRFGNGEKAALAQSVGPRILEVFDTRPPSSRPDQAAIANLSEDTGNHVRWFEGQPPETKPDLGIVAQLDSIQPDCTNVEVRSPLGVGALIRHRVRRQLHGAFLSESRQGLPMPPSGDMFADKIVNCVTALEGTKGGKIGLQFAPNVHAVSDMLEEKRAGFVAVSSSAIDPACFLGGWIKGTYLWDYDLPSYSHRAGDTSGYYLLSRIRGSDREALGKVLGALPGCKALSDEQIEQILLEVARRGIPTVRGLSGDNTGATGDLGLFLAVRLLQDQFRLSGNANSLLPVLSGSPDDASIAIIIPVDPFRGYLGDMARSLGRERKDASLLRPDLLVVGIHICGSQIRFRLTPVEVKCRNQANTFSSGDAKEALAQARSLSTLLQAVQERATSSLAWKLAYQHLLLSMIGFGLRVYSQQELVTKQAARWADYHERIASAILSSAPSISIDESGRLIVVDGSPQSDARDQDGDGFAESVYLCPEDAGCIVAGDAQGFYDSVRRKIGNWQLLPPADSDAIVEALVQEASPRTAHLQGGDCRLSSDEATLHPDTSVDAPVGINDQRSGIPPSRDIIPMAALPEEASTGVILSVGTTVDGFEARSLSLNISDTRLNQLNIGVVGDLGTGKTQLLKSLIFQIASAQKQNRDVKPRFLIFDYKRDYSSPEFVEATGARVVRPYRLPLNLFDTASLGESVAPWLDRFRFFADVLDKVYSGIGPVQRDKLKGAVRNAYETRLAQGRPPTIYDIHAEYRALLSGKADSPMAIIDDLVDMEVFEKQPGKTMPFDEFLDGIVVISLDAMGQDDRSKNMLVAVMLNMFYENMLRTPKRPFLGNSPQLRVIDSYLLVDEADNIMRYEFDVLRKLLLQGREFGTGVILASQYLRHFKAGATDYREPLLTWFIHKVPNTTPAELGALGFTSDLGELSDRVKTLPNHHCMYKSYDIPGEVIRGLPFYEIDKARYGGV